MEESRRLQLAEELGVRLAAENAHLIREHERRQAELLERIRELEEGRNLSGQLSSPAADREAQLREQLQEALRSRDAEEARAEGLRSEVTALAQWAERANEKLKRAQQQRKEAVDEAEALKARVMVLTDRSEKLRSRVAVLEEQARTKAASSGVAAASVEDTPTHKRLMQLEDDLSTARDSLRRKRDREQRLMAEKDSLETANKTLTRQLFQANSENEELREKLALAVEGMATADGLRATVARAHVGKTEDDLSTQPGDVVTVLSCKGDTARVVLNGTTGEIPFADLACLGIPLGHYVELVVPDQTERARMLEEWQVEASVANIRTPLSRPWSANMKDSAAADSAEVASIRKKVEGLLVDIDESFVSYPASPQSRSMSSSSGDSFLVTPRGRDQESRGDVYEALSANLKELTLAAQQYNGLFASLNGEAIPLLRRTLGSESAASLSSATPGETNTARATSVEGDLAFERQRREALAQDYDKLLLQMDATRKECERQVQAERRKVEDANQENGSLKRSLSSVVHERDALVDQCESLKQHVNALRTSESAVVAERDRLVVDLAQARRAAEEAAASAIAVNAAVAFERENGSRGLEGAAPGDHKMPDVETLQLAEEKATLSRTLTDQEHTKEVLQLQMDLNDAQAESERRALVIESLSAEIERLQGSDVLLANQKERIVLLEEKIKELNKVIEADVLARTELMEERRVLERKVLDGENARSVLAQQVAQDREQIASLSEQLERVRGGPVDASSLPPLSSKPTTTSTEAVSVSPAAGRRLQNLFTKMKRSGSRKGSSTEVFATGGNDPTRAVSPRSAGESASHGTASSSVDGSEDSLIEHDDAASSAAATTALAVLSRPAAAPEASAKPAEPPVSSVTPEQSAERFANDATRPEEISRRSQVLKNIPGIKVVDPTEALKTKLAHAEDKIAELAEQVEVGNETIVKLREVIALLEASSLHVSSPGDQDFRSVRVDDSALDDILGISPAPVAEDQRARDLELQLAQAKAREAEVKQQQKERARDEAEELRRVRFELDDALKRLNEAKEDKARVVEHEEAEKSKLRADIARLKADLEVGAGQAAAIQLMKEQARDASEESRRLRFERDDALARLTEAKEDKARVIEHEEAEKSKLRGDNARLKAELEAAVKSATELKFLKETLELGMASQQKNVSGLEQSAKQSTTELEETKKRLQEALLAKEKAEKASDEKARIVDAKIKEAAVVITQLQASKTEADQRYEAAVKEHAAQLAKAEQRLADASAVILTLQESQRALTQQVADAKVVEKGLRDEMVSAPKAQEANAAADAELASAKATIVQLQTLNKKFAEELKASNEKAKAVAAYEARIVDATQVISALHEQNKRLEAQVAVAVAAEKAARDTQAAQEADAKKSLSQYEASAIEAKSVIERLHAANKALEEKASADARVFTQQNEKLSANAKAIDALESRLVAATGIIEELHRKSSTPVVETRQAQAVPIAVTATASREVVSGSPSDEPPQQDPEIKLLESKLLEATKALSVARNQKKDAEDRLASATAVSATLTATVKQLEKDNDDLKAKTQKLTAAFKELSQRYNQTMTELKASSASEVELKEALNTQRALSEKLRAEVARLATVNESLERLANPTPAKTPVKTIESVSPFSTPVRGGKQRAPEPTSKALSDLMEAVAATEQSNVGAAKMETDSELARRGAVLDLREAQVEAREALLAHLKEAREAVTKLEAMEASERRLRREVELELSKTRLLLQNKEEERAQAATRAKEAEALLLKQQGESQNMMTVLHNQLGQLQLEKAELRKALEKKLQNDKEAAQTVSLEMRLRLMSEQHAQSEQDHRIQLKFVQDELASQQRLRETYEEVNAALKASNDLVKAEADTLRKTIEQEAQASETLRKERDAALEELERVTIDRNMFERIGVKLQKRLLDNDSSDDEGRSKTELDLRERISSLQEKLQHENKRKHQLFETVESLRTQIRALQPK